MLLPLNLIATIENTVYLYCFDLKILLPINIGNKNSVYVASDTNYPNIYETLIRVARGLKSSVCGIKIYLQQDEVFYSYIMMRHQNEMLEINCRIEDALKIAEITKSKIFIHNNLLMEQGIRITKQLLTDALRQDTVVIK